MLKSNFNIFSTFQVLSGDANDSTSSLDEVESFDPGDRYDIHRDTGFHTD
jgi:hypothetical protein